MMGSNSDRNQVPTTVYVLVFFPLSIKSHLDSIVFLPFDNHSVIISNQVVILYKRTAFTVHLLNNRNIIQVVLKHIIHLNNNHTILQEAVNSTIRLKIQTKVIQHNQHMVVHHHLTSINKIHINKRMITNLLQ